MPNIFVTSDTHFGHAGVCKFLREDGTKLRPWDTPEEMDEEMVKRWNEVVRPNDKVYHLGDVVINRRAFPTLHRLNGDKILIKGNHDVFKMEDYTPHFRDIRGYHVMDKMIMSHIPVHPDSKGRFTANLHGHLHHRRVVFMNGAEIDPWYQCVCVEHTDYRPIEFQELRDRVGRMDESV